MPHEHRRVQIAQVSTGVVNLDPVLGGGIPEMSLTILAGPAGAGKTTLTQQIAFHNATPERPAVYFGALGEPSLKLLRYQQQFEFFRADAVGRAVHFLDAGDAARVEGVDGVMKRIRDALRRLSPGLVIVDSFRAVEDLARQDTSIAKRVFAHDLAVLLASSECTGILVGEYSEREAGIGPEFTVADNVLLLTQELDRNSVVRRLRVLKVRGQAPQPGRHAFRISSAGIEIFPRLAALDKTAQPRGEERASFGVGGLDEMMRGGIPRGQSCIVAGSSGTGKTLLALHFAIAGAEAGDPCVMATFEESPAEHAAKMRGFGWNLEDLERRGLLEMVYLRPVDLSMDEVLHEVRQAVARRSAKRVVLNSISGLEIALPDTDRQELREGLYRMTSGFTARGVTTLLTTEIPDLVGDARISTQGISFLSDNIVLLRYVEIAAEIRRAIAVLKMRTSAHDSTLREYRIGAKGVIVESPFTDYSGILTGIPTPRAAAEPRPFTAGLGDRERQLMETLLTVKQATSEELAEALGVAVDETRRSLERLADTGYVMKSAAKAGKAMYRVSLVAPGESPPRRRR